ncbi:MAG TPA: hypothetical protein VLV45_05215 [Gemmatimonadales bacterium]|nr:hypothetical protein [Gemmatimonadales bacterium]
MKRFETNVGRFDALSRRIVGALALLDGLVSLGGFYHALTLLTWVVLSLSFCTGLFFLAPGIRGGTAFSGFLIMAIAALDGWFAVTGRGGIALVLGAIVAAFDFGTAALGWGPLNALARLDTRKADRQWT